MFELKRENIHRVVETELERDFLISKGFSLLQDNIQEDIPKKKKKTRKSKVEGE